MLSRLLHRRIHCTLDNDLHGFLLLAWRLINCPAMNHDASVTTMTTAMCINGAVIYSDQQCVDNSTITDNHNY